MYRTRTFCDIFPDEPSFVSGYNHSPLGGRIGDTTKLSALYYLLYARYGNSSIASSDETRFQYQLYSIIFQYGPSWEKQMEIQKNIINLSEEELAEGTTQIFNLAQNPDISPTTQALSELPYISQQNVSKVKKGKMEQYAAIIDLLKADVTENFLQKFAKLFLKIVQPECAPIYCEDDECCCDNQEYGPGFEV